jgi:hypothetical protein
VGLKDTPRTKFIPSAGPLGSDKEHGPRKDTWNYQSAIGILQYLANNTRPDISFAVSQVSRFANDPRCTHETAVKHIVRYLCTSEDKGLIVKPSNAIPLKCWCDSDFAGLFGHESNDDPRSAKSRTGFIITFGGMPLIWKSKLQTETALSSCEAELLALSSGLRYLLPIADTVVELGDCYNLVSPLPATIQVWEDNRAAQILASSNPTQFTPRSRYYSTKMWWFKEHMITDHRSVTISSVTTENNIADIMTKPLPRPAFERLRKRISGW